MASEHTPLERALSEEVAAHFGYLDALRESGLTNMFAAAPYLARDHEIPLAEARAFLTAWMGTFSEEAPEVRARAAISKARGDAR